MSESSPILICCVQDEDGVAFSLPNGFCFSCKRITERGSRSRPNTPALACCKQLLASPELSSDRHDRARRPSNQAGLVGSAQQIPRARTTRRGSLLEFE